MTNLIYLVLYFVFFGASIWISQRAKPLGDMPYRWGAYVGMTAAWTSLLLIASAVPAFSAGRLPGGSALCAVAIVAAVSGLGILRRRRFGVVALWLMYGMLILMTPFLEPMPDQPVLMAIRTKPASLPELAGQARSFSSVVSLVIGAVYFVATFVYFKHRWSAMTFTSPRERDAAHAASSKPPRH